MKRKKHASVGRFRVVFCISLATVEFEATVPL
jgi:hypothetical protein